MSKEILQNIVDDFSPEKFIRFFRDKNHSFTPFQESIDYYNDEDFSDGKKLGEIAFTPGEKLIVYSFKVNKNLTERSGKKAQYVKSKKILKEIQADAGIFVFHDSESNFRFSLIYIDYFGTKRKFSYYKRFTFYVSPKLTNKTFLQQIGECSFLSLEEIKSAFSVEPVTKQFYEELQTWYFWAMDKIKFPVDYKYNEEPEKDKEIRNAINLIRLITRIIFIWFLKQKGLVDRTLFDRGKLKNIVKGFMEDQNASNYYNAILQNLFFATLNQKMDKRKFAKDGDFFTNREQYDVKTLYRYADKFLINKDKVLEFFKDIPFLNGGLFDCLDKEKIYIDGFSRNAKKQAIIPDYLFFQKNEIKVGLSKYGLGMGKPVRGLTEILKSYNFTIDENTPIDQEVALDPELLGRVFENLLASYNPETATTARKATGSYYTPREIVNYMVDESIFYYLKDKFPDISEEDFRLLISYSDEIPESCKARKQDLISAIDNIKILDPACGSGAFPMGILHKLVYILQKLDPKNEYWYELQYQKALKASEEVFKKGSKAEREEILKEINEAFDESTNYPGYARKLYLIENCIYGVDIQPIAIQISKLRFFISLILDQKVDKGKENFGIRALPNLETKFVTANTLMGIEIPDYNLVYDNSKTKQIQDKLAETRHKYFKAKTRREKLKYQKQDLELRKKLAEIIKSLLLNRKQGEIAQVQEEIKNNEKKLQQAIQEPENIKIIESINLFGEKKQEKIDIKQRKIKKIKKYIKDYEKQLRTLQKQAEGDFTVQIAKKIANFDLFDQNASASWFDPEWMFGVKDGFDIVIANPPYVKEDINKKAFDGLRNSECYQGKMDLWYLFGCRGLDILKNDGIICFIATNNWVSNDGASKFRNKVVFQAKIIDFIDFGNYKIFSAGIQTMVFVAIKNSKLPEYNLNYGRLQDDSVAPEILSEFVNASFDVSNFNFEKYTVIFRRDNHINSYISFVPVRIGNVLDKIKAAGNFYLRDDEISSGIDVMQDFVAKKHLEKLGEGFVVGEGIFVLSNCEKRKKVWNNDERKIIKPYYTTKEISRYRADKLNNFWILYTGAEINKRIGDFPNLKKHLDKFQKIITSVNKPYGLHRTREERIFLGEKILSIRKCVRPSCALVDFPCYVSRAFLIIRSARVDLKFLLAILNSNLMAFWLLYKGKRQGNQYQIDKVPLKQIPIKNISGTKQAQFIKLIDEILAITKDNDYLENPTKQAQVRKYERQIDQMVYELYGLTEEEIRIVEGRT